MYCQFCHHVYQLSMENHWSADKPVTFRSKTNDNMKEVKRSSTGLTRVARLKKSEKAKFDHKRFQKKAESSKWKGLKFPQQFAKISRFKAKIFSTDCKFYLDFSKTSLEIYFFLQHSRKDKKGQMSKPFYFWQTVS